MLSLLQLDTLVQGIVYCDYNIDNLYATRSPSSCKPERAFYTAAQAAVHAAPDAHVYFVALRDAGIGAFGPDVFANHVECGHC